MFNYRGVDRYISPTGVVLSVPGDLVSGELWLEMILI
jgi:hypothetical protein